MPQVTTAFSEKPDLNEQNRGLGLRLPWLAKALDRRTGEFLSKYLLSYM